MRFLCAAVFALAGLSAHCTDPCKTRPRQDSIQSGQATLQNGLGQLAQLQKQYPLTIDFPMPSPNLQVAVALQNFNGYFPKSPADYSVTAQRKGDQNSIVIVYRNRENGWKKIDVSYLVSAIQEVKVGSFVAESLGKYGSSQENGFQTVRIENMIMDTVDKDSVYEVQAFLSGVKSSLAQPDFKLKQPKFSAEQQKISINLVSGQVPQLESLQISYIIWKQANKFQVFEYAPYQDQFDSDYRLFGLVGFNGDDGYLNGVAVNSDRVSCVGKGCANQCTTLKDCTGKVVDGKCALCGLDEKQEDDGTCTLTKCLDNEELKEQKCECKEGFNRIKGECQVCDSNSYYDIGREDCVCNYGFYKSSGKCLNCHESCGACRGPGNDKCVTCAGDKYVLKQKKCVLKEQPVGDSMNFAAASPAKTLGLGGASGATMDTQNGKTPIIQGGLVVTDPQIPQGLPQPKANPAPSAATPAPATDPSKTDTPTPKVDTVQSPKTDPTPAPIPAPEASKAPPKADVTPPQPTIEPAKPDVTPSKADPVPLQPVTSTPKVEAVTPNPVVAPQPAAETPAKTETTPPKPEPITQPVVEAPKADPTPPKLPIELPKADPKPADVPKAETTPSQPVAEAPSKTEAQPPKVEPTPPQPVDAPKPEPVPPKTETIPQPAAEVVPKTDPPQAQTPKVKTEPVPQPVVDPPKQEPISQPAVEASKTDSPPPKTDPVPPQPAQPAVDAPKSQATPPKEEPIPAKPEAVPVQPATQPAKVDSPSPSPSSQPTVQPPKPLQSSIPVHERTQESPRKQEVQTPQQHSQPVPQNEQLAPTPEVVALPESYYTPKPIESYQQSPDPQPQQQQAPYYQPLQIHSGNAMLQSGTVLKGYTLSNLPYQLSSNQQICRQLFKLTLTHSLIIPGMKFQYINSSRSPKILISFDFGSVPTPPPFEYELRINPELGRYFTRQDMDVLIKERIDPGVLVRRRVDRNLRMSFEDVQDFNVQLTDQEDQFIFG